MTDLPPARSAADAVRYLYLAGVAQREGHEGAAQRLRAKAAAWMAANLPAGGTPSAAAPLPRPIRGAQGEGSA